VAGWRCLSFRQLLQCSDYFNRGFKGQSQGLVRLCLDNCKLALAFVEC